MLKFTCFLAAIGSNASAFQPVSIHKVSTRLGMTTNKIDVISQPDETFLKTKGYVWHNIYIILRFFLLKLDKSNNDNIFTYT
jgi:hypothetical protein